jgi:hypothetical protein
LAITYWGADWRAHLGDVVARENANDARDLGCRLAVDGQDPRMGVRAANEGDMHHPRHVDVVGVPSPSIGEPADFPPRNRFSDDPACCFGLRHVSRTPDVDCFADAYWQPETSWANNR